MKKTNDYAKSLSDGYPVVDDTPRHPVTNKEISHPILDKKETYTPHIDPETPHYGKPNIGYKFLVKYGKLMQINTLVTIIVFSFIMAITLLMTDIETRKAPIPVNVTTTVVHHDVNKAINKQKEEKNYSEFKHQLDSLYEARRIAALEKEQAENERRKQYVRDSIMQYLHARDSIRLELLREDSIKIELERQKKVKIDYIAVIDDGITKRTLKVNSIGDSLTAENTEVLGKSFFTATYQAVVDRQKEINKNKNYYKFLRLNPEDFREFEKIKMKYQQL